MGYPEFEDEVEILFSHAEIDPFEQLTPVVSGAEVLLIQREVRKIRVDRTVAEYLLHLVEATRKDTRLRLAVSPRGSLTLYRMAQSRAMLDNRTFVQPEDIRALAVPVLAHRVMLDTKARYGGLQTSHIIEEALDKIPVPR